MHIYHKELDKISTEALSKRVEEMQNEIENVVEKDESELTPIEKSFKYFPKKIEEAAKKKPDAVDSITINFEKQRAEEFKKATGTTPEEIQREKVKKQAKNLVGKLEARGATTGYLAGIAGEKKPAKSAKPDAPKVAETPVKSVYQKQREIASELMKKRPEAGSFKPEDSPAAPQKEKTPFERQREISSQLMKKRMDKEAPKSVETTPSKSVEIPVVKSKVVDPNRIDVGFAKKKESSKFSSFKDFLTKTKDKLSDVAWKAAWNVGYEAETLKGMFGAAKDVWNGDDKEKAKFKNPYSQKPEETEKKK